MGSRTERDTESRQHVETALVLYQGGGQAALCQGGVLGEKSRLGVPRQTSWTQKSREGLGAGFTAF